MPGQWLTTQVENGKALPSTGTAEQTVTIDLPRSNFLGAINGEVRATHATSIAITLSRVRVTANGSAVIVDLPGGILRGILKYETGRSGVQGGAGAAATARWVFHIPFGRFRRDEDVILPAKLFKTLQLQLTLTLSATATGTGVYVSAEEYVSNDDAATKRVRTLKEVYVKEDVATSETVRVRLPLGNFLRALYIYVDDIDVVDGSESGSNILALKVNNGAEVPFSMRAYELEQLALWTYRFDDADLPDEVELDNLGEGGTASDSKLYKIDFDVAENLAKVLDTSRFNELTLEAKAAASGVSSGDIRVIVEEIAVIA